MLASYRSVSSRVENAFKVPESDNHTCTMATAGYKVKQEPVDAVDLESR